MLELKVDTEEAERLVLDVLKKVKDPKPVLKRFHGYMLGRTGATIQHLGRALAGTVGQSSSYRGATWKSYAIQYRRKTGGVVVPAWGGVPKIRGEGQVKGKLRPSGRRISARSNIMRDTGRLSAAAGQSRRWTDGGMTLEMFTRGIAYGPRQQSLRRFLFFETPKDLRVAQQMAVDYINAG